MTSMPPAATTSSRLNASFKRHTIIALVVMALLGAIDWYTAEPYWIHWVVLGWGAGLGLHYWLAHRA